MLFITFGCKSAQEQGQADKPASTPTILETDISVQATPPNQPSSETIPAERSDRIQKTSEYERLTIVFDYKLPDVRKTYPIYAARHSSISAEDYSRIMEVCGDGEEWVTVSGKPFSVVKQTNGGFTAYLGKNTDSQAGFRGEIGGYRYAFFTTTAMVTVLSETDFLHWPPSDELVLALEKEPEITLEEAQILADSYKTDFGIYENYGLLRADRAEAVDLRKYEMINDGWVFIYTPQFANILMEYETTRTLWSGERPVNGAPWLPMEALSVYVTKNGVESVLQESRTDYSLCGESGILSAQDMAEIIENWIAERFSEPLSKNTVKTEFEVKDIRLRYALLATEKADEGIAVPSWEVLVKTHYWRSDSTSADYDDKIIFNAIDGSYIEPYVSIDVIKPGAQTTVTIEN